MASAHFFEFSVEVLYRAYSLASPPLGFFSLFACHSLIQLNCVIIETKAFMSLSFIPGDCGLLAKVINNSLMQVHMRSAATCIVSRCWMICLSRRGSSGNCRITARQFRPMVTAWGKSSSHRIVLSRFWKIMDLRKLANSSFI